MNISQLITLAEKFEIDEEKIKQGKEIKKLFVERWPIDRISQMTVEEYADTRSKDCFIYWLERKLGGIGGGNSSKFAIYRSNEGNYSEGAGSSKKILQAEELKEKLNLVLRRITQAIDFVKNDEIHKLNDYDTLLWPMVLNKILVTYFPYKFIDIVADTVLNAIAVDLGIEDQKSSIVTNHFINEKIKTIEPFASWSKEKLAYFLWETYNPRVFRNYYLIGSKYGGHDDMFPKMLEESVISTGFARNHNLQNILGVPQKEIKQFLESIEEESHAYFALRYFLNLKPGDWVAVKSSGSPRENQPFLSIVGIAEVIEDDNFYEHDPDGLGQKIKVKFLKAPVYKEFPIGGYGATMHRVNNNKHISAIFFSDFDEIEDEKSMLIKMIIRKYKEMVRADNNEDEIYKWNLIQDFQSLWNIDEPDFSEMLKKINFENLIYQNSFYLIRQSHKYSEEARELFEMLYDENTDLKNRITNFQAKAKEIFRKYLPDKKHSQDERAIATYLTFMFPDKYTFYKSSYYEKYVKLLKEKPREAGEKYLHYLELIDDLKRNYLLKDKELLNLSDGTLKEKSYKDSVRNILAQDILYRVLEQSDFMMEYYGTKEKDPGGEIEPDEFPLNLILYGPPGTGKTYKLRNTYIRKFTSKQTTKTKEEYLMEIAEKLTWWQVISIIVLDLGKCKVNDIYTHPLLQSKLAFTATKTPKNTIWNYLQTHTKSDCPNVAFEKRSEPQFFWKDDNGDWTIDDDIIESETPEIFEILERIKNYVPEIIEKKRYLFTSFHQSYSYEDFIEGIKPVLEEDESAEGEIGYKIVPGVFKRIAQQASDDPDNPYALFIDEINRGNIANIFGELITLIEDDKRKGAPNELKVILPYSKEEFSVPKNLHIIGTMNTADRSVEALDTALRRRFSFHEIVPVPEIIENHPDLETDLQSVLSKINERIERLIDKDHRIGHSYFMEIRKSNNPLEALKKVFAIKILPLLNEYFYGDPVKIGCILGEHFIRRKEEKSIDWPSQFVPDDLEIKDVYEILDPLTFEDETPFISIYEV
ncbi:MAG: AAA family ATPase [Bacteroidales bacterium]|nr:AAA family ATPase [Bacteroidales bacterium]MBN2863707.1 AAA family ATPase [Bacteroidales bacterium]